MQNVQKISLNQKQRNHVLNQLSIRKIVFFTKKSYFYYNQELKLKNIIKFVND